MKDMKIPVSVIRAYKEIIKTKKNNISSMDKVLFLKRLRENTASLE